MLLLRSTEDCDQDDLSHNKDNYVSLERTQLSLRSCTDLYHQENAQQRLLWVPFQA